MKKRLPIIALLLLVASAQYAFAWNWTWPHGKDGFALFENLHNKP